MAPEIVPSRVASDLIAVMGRIDEARIITMLATKAEGLDKDDARTVFSTLQQILDDVHNGIDVAREMLETDA